MIKSKIFWFKVRVKRWVCHWVIDQDGDIGVQFFKLVTLMKYKETTIVHVRGFSKEAFLPAPKFVRGVEYVVGRNEPNVRVLWSGV